MTDRRIVEDQAPGCADDDGTCGKVANCARDWWGIPTPACAHAHIVSPEQSNATPGSALAKTHRTPIWVVAALIAVPERDEAAGMFTGAAGAAAGVGAAGAGARDAGAGDAGVGA